jgi:hypothetical protein
MASTLPCLNKGTLLAGVLELAIWVMETVRATPNKFLLLRLSTARTAFALHQLSPGGTRSDDPVPRFASARNPLLVARSVAQTPAESDQNPHHLNPDEVAF